MAYQESGKTHNTIIFLMAALFVSLAAFKLCIVAMNKNGHHYPPEIEDGFNMIFPLIEGLLLTGLVIAVRIRLLSSKDGDD